MALPRSRCPAGAYYPAMSATLPPQVTDHPPGVDVDSVTAWLTEQGCGYRAPLQFEILQGGHSNFTYRVQDGDGRAFVLRRPPLGELLPSAHDMEREFKVISALWPTPVPVPEPIAYCGDTTVTGARFYCMGAIDGKSLYEGADVQAQVPEGLRRKLSFSFIDVLADLHALDPDEIGLGELGRKDAYVARQLKRWFAAWNSSPTPDQRGPDRRGGAARRAGGPLARTGSRPAGTRRLRVAQLSVPPGGVRGGGGGLGDLHVG